jgi:hypothetical protein
MPAGAERGADGGSTTGGMPTGGGGGVGAPLLLALPLYWGWLSAYSFSRRALMVLTPVGASAMWMMTTVIKRGRHKRIASTIEVEYSIPTTW